MLKRTALISLAFALITLAGCDVLSRSQATTAETEQNQTPQEVEIIIPVEAKLPTRGDISAHFETTTRIEAETRVQVVAEGVGECLDLKVEEGDLVEAGQVLAELDKKEILASLGQAEVQVRQTKTAYDRAQDGCEMGLIPPAERDNAKFAYEQALATLDMQKVQLSKLTVRAPIGGLLTHRLIQPGQMVSAGSPIFTIVDPSSFMLVINPPERELGRLATGQRARVTIDALGSSEFEAAVRRINPNVDPVSGTVKVILDFDAEIRAKLREAAFARVRLVMDTHQNALLVPKDAVLEENARKYLFVVEQDKPEPSADVTAAPAASEEQAPQEPQKAPEAEETTADDKPTFLAKRVEIETGFEDSNSAEVVKGIDDTSLIVVLGQHTLKPGSRVTITNASDEILAKAGLSAEQALAAAKARRKQASDAANLRMGRGRRMH